MAVSERPSLYDQTETFNYSERPDIICSSVAIPTSQSSSPVVGMAPFFSDGTSGAISE